MVSNPEWQSSYPDWQAPPPEWQIFIVIFSSETEPYDYLSDICSQLKYFSNPSFIINILQHTENQPYLIQLDNKQFKRVKYQSQHEDLISDFVRSTWVETKYKCISLYSHGNSWFYRHDSRVQTFGHLFQSIKDLYFDVICLESCYCATVETCYELRNMCKYLVASEGKHASIPIFDFNLFKNCRQCNPYELAISLAVLFNQKCNYLYQNSDILNNLIQGVGDVAVLDLGNIEKLVDYFNQYPINNLPLESYKKSKCVPALKSGNCNYDLFAAMTNSPSFEEFQKIFYSIVKFRLVSDFMANMSSRFNGLAFCPVPWDSEHAWTYKFLDIFGKNEGMLYKA